MVIDSGCDIAPNVTILSYFGFDKMSKLIVTIPTIPTIMSKLIVTIPTIPTIMSKLIVTIPTIPTIMSKLIVTIPTIPTECRN